MAGRTAWILGDQLSHDNAALAGADRVLMVESRAGLANPGFHRQKLHLLLSAMRHFAAELRNRGVEVDLRAAPDLAAGLAEHARVYDPNEVALLEPTSAVARRRLGALARVTLVRDNLFLTHPDEFAAWARPRKRLVMEDFYRWQRKRLGVLIDAGDPAGGRWNLDRENRRPPPRDRRPPEGSRPEEDDLDHAVRRDLDAMNPNTFGEDGPRLWPATHAEARRILEEFVTHRLADFGPFQDAMLNGERFMWHAQLSSSLNLGLISPRACVHAVEAAYREGAVPLQSAEGFIRQVIGWREYVWGMYWLREQSWPQENALGAHAPLPQALRDGRTHMRCVADAVNGLRTTGYAHHIERLMLFGNLMLLLGVDPAEAVRWYHLSFIDGYRWVMAPNVIGMALWADGGAMMTKPYAASGRYVDRMSDHCSGCRYSPRQRTGEDACPYNALYWDFLARHRERLAPNRRMRGPYRNLDRLDPAELAEIRTRADDLREAFASGRV